MEVASWMLMWLYMCYVGYNDVVLLPPLPPLLPLSPPPPPPPPSPLHKLELQRQQLLADRQQFQRDQLKAAEMRSLQSPTLQPQTPLQLPPVRPPHRSPSHGSKTAAPVATQVETKPEGKDTRGVVGESKPAETGSKPGEVKLVDESAKLVEKEEEKKEGLPATVQSESDLATKDQPEGGDPTAVAWPVNDPAAASQTGTNQDTITHQEETPSEINPPASDEVERGLPEGESCEVKAAEVELQASEVDLSELAAEGLLVTADTDQQTGSPTLAPQLSSGDGEETIEESFPPEMPAEENLRGGGGGGEGGEEEGVLMGVSEGRVMCV